MTMKKALLLSTLLLCSVATVCAPLRDLMEEDEKAWSRLADVPVLSPDGKWLIYIWSGYHRVNDKPRNGPPELILKRVDTGGEQRRNLGVIAEGQAKLKMSPSGRWIAFTQASTQADRVDVMLMDLQSLKRMPRTTAPAKEKPAIR